MMAPGLGIISSDLCIYAGRLTQDDLDVAYATAGAPTYKARPGSVVELEPANMWDRINTWVNSHPVLAGGLLLLSYLGFEGLRRK